jgi:hypothetical protein
MIFPSRRDRRAEWLQCTSRLESCATLDELAPKLVDAVGQVLGATGAVLYLADPGDGGLRAAAAVGTGCPGADTCRRRSRAVRAAPAGARARGTRERLGRRLVLADGSAGVHRGVGDRAASLA